MVKIRYTSLNKQEAFYLISLSIVQNVKELFKLVPKVNEPQTPSLTSNKKIQLNVQLSTKQARGKTKLLV